MSSYRLSESEKRYRKARRNRLYYLRHQKALCERARERYERSRPRMALSRRMIAMLQIVRDCEYAGLVNANTAISTLQSLERRGLILFRLKLGTPYGGKWELTPAGVCVVQLLEFANLMQNRVPVAA